MVDAAPFLSHRSIFIGGGVTFAVLDTDPPTAVTVAVTAIW